MNILNRARETSGAAAVEFAVISPIFVFFTFVALQFAVIFFTYLSLLSTTRDVVRWVTVNPNTIDSIALAAAQARLPSDLDATKLSVTFTPPCATLSQNKCANRAAGQDIAVTLSYDSSSLYFLPTQFNFPGGMAVQLPAAQLSYTMHMQAEPA